MYDRAGSSHVLLTHWLCHAGMSRVMVQPYRVCRGACRRHSGGVAYPYWTLDLGVQRGQRDVDRHGVSEGNEVKGISTARGRSRTKHFDDSRKRYARSATGETIAETRKAIRNHSLSDWEWPVSNEGLSRARRPSGGSRWSPQQHQSQKGGRKGEIEYKVEGRRASHRVLRIEMDSRF